MSRPTFDQLVKEAYKTFQLAILNHGYIPNFRQAFVEEFVKEASRYYSEQEVLHWLNTKTGMNIKDTPEGLDLIKPRDPDTPRPDGKESPFTGLEVKDKGETELVQARLTTGDIPQFVEFPKDTSIAKELSTLEKPPTDTDELKVKLEKKIVIP